MKLELGQKIGIYEVLCRNAEPFKTNQNVIGIPFESNGVSLYNKLCMGFAYTDNEVRKVGSLIVKRLK